MMKWYNVFFIVLTLSFIISYKAVGQCFINISVNTHIVDTIIRCENQPLLLESYGSCPNVYILNDFNDETLGSGWSSNCNPVFNNPCGPGSNGTTYCWVGSALSSPREIVSGPFSISSSSTLCFDLKFAIQAQSSPCEGPDEIDEGVSLQYLVYGDSVWRSIAYFQPDGIILPEYPGESDISVGNGSTPFTIWENYCFNMPSGAVSNSTQFRWRQERVTSSTMDHWGIDNVEVGCSANIDVLWSGPAGFSYIGFSPPIIYPTQSGWYEVEITDGTSSAFDHVYIGTIANPLSVFSCNLFGVTAIYNNSSTGYDSCFWDFGDGTTSTQTSPVHTYSTTGSFPVTLIVTNSCSSDTSTQMVSIDVSSVPGTPGNTWTVYPNPASGFVLIQPESNIKYTVELLSVDGRIVKTFIAQGEERLNVEGLKPGLYFLEISTKDGEKLQFPQVILDSQ